MSRSPSCHLIYQFVYFENSGYNQNNIDNKCLFQHRYCYIKQSLQCICTIHRTGFIYICRNRFYPGEEDGCMKAHNLPGKYDGKRQRRPFCPPDPFNGQRIQTSVSYTHLDVYKRQCNRCAYKPAPYNCRFLYIDHLYFLLSINPLSF